MMRSQPQPSIALGFRDPVGDAQAVFRTAMNAMARPGRPVMLGANLTPPAPLSAAMAAVLLTLCDFETPVWLDPALLDAGGVREFLRFHTGARLVATPAEATFAVISDPMRMPPLADFAQGTADYPDRSTTLIVSVHTLKAEGWKLEGPGINGAVHFSAAPLPEDFAGQMRANRATFPRGVDVLLVTGNAIAALPRSVTLTEAG
jgi:alpha-D-ribose 1-methylphosphonate 5-triphosphate synthase subunit PhnH